MSTQAYRRVVRAVDSVLALVLFFPALCCYWRGAWDLISVHVLPGTEPTCYWLQMTVGSFGVFSYFLLPLLHKCVHPDSKCSYWVVTRLFMMYNGILYMFLWRGVWGVADFYLTRRWTWSLALLVLLLAVMFPLRIIRQTIWPPFAVCADRGDLLVAANRFGAKPENRCRYVLDSLFTALVSNYLAILTWRTLWCVWDDLLYPDQPLRADLVSFCAGLCGTVLLHAAQDGLAAVSRRFEKADQFYNRLVYEAVMYVLILVVMSALWRGGWNLNIRYLISSPDTGGLVNHLCGSLLLLLLNVYNMVGGCGCALDGSDPDGGAFFPVQYISCICTSKLDEVEERDHGKNCTIVNDTNTLQNGSSKEELYDKQNEDHGSLSNNNRIIDDKEIVDSSVISDTKVVGDTTMIAPNQQLDGLSNTNATGKGYDVLPRNPMVWYERRSSKQEIQLLVPKQNDKISDSYVYINLTDGNTNKINPNHLDSFSSSANEHRGVGPKHSNNRTELAPSASRQDFGDPWIKRKDFTAPSSDILPEHRPHVAYDIV